MVLLCNDVCNGLGNGTKKFTFKINVHKQELYF